MERHGVDEQAAFAMLRDQSRRANRKVETRFAFIERELHKQGKTPEQASMEEMELLWQQAKK